MFPCDRTWKGSSLHQCSGCYWNNATIVKGQEGNTYYYCKVRLNSFLSILSFEHLFFTLGFFQVITLLEKCWMLSGCGGIQKSEIVMSLVARIGYCCFCEWNEPERRSNRRKGKGLLTSLVCLFACYFQRLYWQ